MVVRWMGPISHKPVKFGKINFLKYLISSRYEKELEVEIADFQKIKGRKMPGNIAESFFSASPDLNKVGKSNITILDSGLPLQQLEKFVTTNPNNEKLIVNDRRGGIIKEEYLSLVDGVVVYSSESYKYYSSVLRKDRVLFLKPSIDPSTYYPSNKKEKEYDLICLVNIKGKKNRLQAIMDLAQTIEKLSIKAVLVCKKKEITAIASRYEKISFIACKDHELANELRKSSAAFVLCDGTDPGMVPIGMLEAGACGTYVMSNFTSGNQPGFTSGNHFLQINNIKDLSDTYSAMKIDIAHSRFMIENMLRSINQHYTNWHRSNELYNFLKMMKQEGSETRISAIV